MLSRLYTPLLMIAVAGSSWALSGPSAVTVCIIVAVSFAMARATRSWVGFVSVVFCSLIVGGMLVMPAVESAPVTVERMRCANNLKQIALALHNYQIDYRCLPPVCVNDENGKPMHSWRVLILPYLGRKDLYDQYKFEEPWNGPNNRKLLAARPSVFVCLSDERTQAEGATDTSYVAVVGPNAAWRLGKPRSLDDAELRGKASTTVMLAETVGANINWTEPKDLSLDALQSATSSPGSVMVSNKHWCYRRDLLYDYEYDSFASSNVALLDQSVESLPMQSRTIKNLPNLLRIGGWKEEDYDLGAYGPTHFKATLRWCSCAALAVWIVSVNLLLYRAARNRKGTPKAGDGHSDRGEETVTGR
jgi:hypothetical protein